MYDREKFKKISKTSSGKNVIYAHYLIAIIYFDKLVIKSLKPLLQADKKIDFLLKIILIQITQST